MVSALNALFSIIDLGLFKGTGEEFKDHYCWRDTHGACTDNVFLLLTLRSRRYRNLLEQCLDLSTYNHSHIVN